MTSYTDEADKLFENIKEKDLVYDVNNKLKSYNENETNYDKDGNMLGVKIKGADTSLTYDSQNKLVKAGDTGYTYDVESNRVSKTEDGKKTSYVYDTNGSISQILETKTEEETTKYVYGLGLLYEETSGNIQVYHYDMRGCTTALTDEGGKVTDRYTYNTYGKVTHTKGSNDTEYLYNGRDGVVTDKNGFLYMRARYSSVELMRFINADVIKGSISDGDTLNRYAYVLGNPVSFIDPFGLSADIASGNYNDSKYCFSGSEICQSIADYLMSLDGDDYKEIGHQVLDLAVMIPGYGCIADGINAIWYAIEGDWGNAGLSALAFVPGIGELAAAGKLGVKAQKIAKAVSKWGDDAVQAIAKYGDDAIEAIGKGGRKALDAIADSGCKAVDSVGGFFKKAAKKASGWFDDAFGFASKEADEVITPEGIKFSTSELDNVSDATRYSNNNSNLKQNKIVRGEHAQIRSAQGRKVNTAINDLNQAKPSNIYICKVMVAM